MKYLAEIIIDGYTDTDGDYSYNLQLSQQRSLAVAQYLLDIQGNFPRMPRPVTESGEISHSQWAFHGKSGSWMQTEM